MYLGCVCVCMGSAYVAAVMHAPTVAAVIHAAVRHHVHAVHAAYMLYVPCVCVCVCMHLDACMRHVHAVHTARIPLVHAYMLHVQACLRIPLVHAYMQYGMYAACACIYVPCACMYAAWHIVCAMCRPQSDTWERGPAAEPLADASGAPRRSERGGVEGERERERT